MQHLLEVRRQFGGRLHQVFLLQQVQRGNTGGAGDRVCRVGVAVGEFHGVFRGRLVHEGLVDLAAGDHRAHRDGAVGHLLGDAHQVRGHAEGFGAGHRAHAAEAGDHFVEDQQDVVLGADFTQALQVTLRRRQYTSRTCQRLDDHGSDVGGVVQLDQLEHLVSQGDTALFRHAFGEGVHRQHGVRQVVDIQQLTEQLAVAVDATEAGTGDVHAVVATGTADDLGLGRLAFQAPVGTHHLQRGVGTLGTGVGIEHMVQVARGQLGDLLGQLERQRVAELEGRGVVQGADLASHRLGDFLAGVPGAAGPQAGQGIEDLAPLVVDQVAAFGRHDQAWVALEVAVGGVGHPVGIQLELAGDTGGSGFGHVHRRFLGRRLGNDGCCCS
ncbi:hypothetical protein D3C72_633590 [compost metagenome]